MNLYNQFWTPLNNRGGGPAGAFGFGGNIYGAAQEPTAADLLSAYEDVVFSCVNLISYNVQKTDIKLCVTTSHGDAPPKSLTKSLDGYELGTRYKNFTRKATNVDEVVEHPLLNLIDRPNPNYSFSKLLGMTSVYMELVGSAFWYLARDTIGQICEIWLLPSHNVTIQSDDGGHVLGYINQQGEKEEYISPEDVIHIRAFNPYDPYTSFGIPPVRAVWQRIQLLRQEQSSWQAVLSNMAIPSLAISPLAEDGMFTPDQSERIAKQFSERFRFGNEGGVYVVQDAVKIDPIQVPPKDLAALTMYDQIKQCVCNVYQVPRPMLDMEDANDSSAEVARRSFQENCISPRVDNILESMSHYLCRPRLFFAAPHVVKPERTFQLQRDTALFQGNVTTLNETRRSQGFTPVDGGDKFLYQLQNIGTPSAQTFQASLDGVSHKEKKKATPRKKPAKKKPTKAARFNYRSLPPDAGPLAKALKAVFDRQAQEVIASFKSGPELKTKNFFPVSTWTEEMARLLQPVLRGYFEEGTYALLSELGGSPDVRRLAVMALDKAVAKATYQFADSTNSTTNLSITEAVEATRKAVEDGLAQGEANAQLLTRIQSIFTDLSERRALLIAETESTRAKHSGELIGIEAAGVQAKKKWLADSQCCDICKALNGKSVEMDTDFATIGTGPYSRIEHPPAHPQCRCTLQYELEE